LLPLSPRPLGTCCRICATCVYYNHAACWHAANRDDACPLCVSSALTCTLRCWRALPAAREWAAPAAAPASWWLAWSRAAGDCHYAVLAVAIYSAPWVLQASASRSSTRWRRVASLKRRSGGDGGQCPLRRSRSISFASRVTDVRSPWLVVWLFVTAAAARFHLLPARPGKSRSTLLFESTATVEIVLAGTQSGYRYFGRGGEHSLSP